MKIKIQLNEHAIAPIRNPGDAAYDLFADLNGRGGFQIIGPGLTYPINTGVRFELPPGHVGIVMARSGLAIKGMDVLGGVIDPSYRGSVKVIIHNTTHDPICFYHGERVGQILILEAPHHEFEVVDELSSTERGENGFGSSGR